MMPTKESIGKKVVSIIQKEINGEEASITADCILMDDCCINSLGVFLIIGQIEQEFNIRFTNQELVGISSVGDLIDTVYRNMNNK